MYDVPESSRPFHKISFIKSFKSKSIIKVKIDHFIHDKIEEYGYLSFKINCNIRPNTTQRRSVEKVPINDWQASVTLILLVFHCLDLAS